MKPIAFTDDMLRAILDGSKTQTRRPIKPQPPAVVKFWVWEDGWGTQWETSPRTFRYQAPFGPGDLLSIHLGGRLSSCGVTIRVKRVWVERLTDIDEDGAKAEGCHGGYYDDDDHTRDRDARDAFFDLWDSIYADRYPVQSDPWVFCCEFEVINP